jgi:hypothetical protein
MSETFFYWVLGIAGAFITLLLMAVGFFLKANYDVLKDLNVCVPKLQTIVEEKNNENEKEHILTEKRLNEHTIKLQEHEIDITILKTKVC